MTQQEYENKIKELQDELEKLKAAKIEAEKPKRWKPNQSLGYWLVCNGDVAVCNYRNTTFDIWNYLTGNCFKTEEEAEEHRKQIEYTARYKNYIEEHSEPLDWHNKYQDDEYQDDKYQKKYVAFFDFNKNEIVIDDYFVTKFQGAIYASSEQIIWDAIEEIGEDNFKKYVLGVK